MVTLIFVVLNPTKEATTSTVSSARFEKVYFPSASVEVPFPVFAIVTFTAGIGFPLASETTVQVFSETKYFFSWFKIV